MLFHLQIPGFSVGWLGVPLFFVLSGYLITGILLVEKDRNEHFGAYAARFWIRRTLRIFPLYYAYLLVNYLIWHLMGKDIHDYVYYLTYTQNFLLGVTKFQNVPGFLGHTWSLAIEEQFYLLWPALVFYLSRASLTRLCVVIIALAPLFRMWIWNTTGNPYLIYTTTIGSADLLAFGCICALAQKQIVELSDRAIAAAVAISAILLSLLITTVGTHEFWRPADWARYPGQAIIFSVAGAFFSAIVIGASRLRWGGMLKNALIVHIGKISYGIYMWHGLIAVAVTAGILRHWELANDNALGVLLTLVITYVVSLGSFRYFETPFLRLKHRL